MADADPALLRRFQHNQRIALATAFPALQCTAAILPAWLPPGTPSSSLADGRRPKLDVPEARDQRGLLDFFGSIGISWDARMAPGGARIWLFFPMKIYDQTSFKEKSTNISTNKMESMISLCDLWLPEAGRRTHLQFICNIFVEGIKKEVRGLPIWKTLAHIHTFLV